MSKNGLIIGGVVLLVVAGAAVFFVNRPANSPASETNNQSNSSMNDMDASKRPDAAPDSTAADDSTKPAATNEVEISNYTYTPGSITIKAGTTVTWTNNDSTAHTVTADKASPDAPASGDINQGASYSFTFKKAGTYHYHCAMHPYMKGTVIVTE